MTLDLTPSGLFIDSYELSNPNGRDSRPSARPSSTLAFELIQLPNAMLTYAFKFLNAEFTHTFKSSSTEKRSLCLDHYDSNLLVTKATKARKKQTTPLGSLLEEYR